MLLAEKIQTLRDAAKFLLCGVLWCLLPSCINEDLSNCGYDYRIDYNVCLQTNLSTEIATELDKEEHQAIATILEQELSTVFTDIAKDVDLSFYREHLLAHHEQHEIDANSASFTLYLPVSDYQHLALANVQACASLLTTGAQTDSIYKISNNLWADTIDAHSIGVFSARLPMAVEDKDTTFHVQLTMCNSAAAAVINQNGYRPKEIFGFTKGFATGFMPNDSLFMFEREQSIRAKQITDNGEYLALYTVNFPSRDTKPATVQPFNRSNAPTQDAGLWQFYIYVKMNDSWTENILSIPTPLKAGALKIIPLHLRDDGTVVSDLPEVGVSVTLDWKSGGNYDIEL